MTDEIRTWLERAVRIARARVPIHVIATADLRQIAELATWRALQSYDARNSGGVPFGGYAWRSVWGAMMMACRRRAYMEAHFDELKPNDRCADARAEHDEGIDRRRVTRILLEALSEMPSDQRRIVAEVVMPGIPLAHWCARNRIPFARAKRIKDAALAALKLELQRHQIYSLPF